MTSNAHGDRILGSLRASDGKGVVRMEDRFGTDIDDLWSDAGKNGACPWNCSPPTAPGCIATSPMP